MLKIWSKLLLAVFGLAMMLFAMFPAKRMSKVFVTRIKHCFDVQSYSDDELEQLNPMLNIMIPSQSIYYIVDNISSDDKKEVALWNACGIDSCCNICLDRIYNWKTDPDCYILKVSSGKTYPVDDAAFKAITNHLNFTAVYDKEACMWRHVQ